MLISPKYFANENASMPVSPLQPLRRLQRIDGQRAFGGLSRLSSGALCRHVAGDRSPKEPRMGPWGLPQQV